MNTLEILENELNQNTASLNGRCYVSENLIEVNFYDNNYQMNYCSVTFYPKNKLNFEIIIPSMHTSNTEDTQLLSAQLNLIHNYIIDFVKTSFAKKGK